MMFCTGLAAVALSTCLYQPDLPGPPPPNLDARWTEASGLQTLYSRIGYSGKRPESVAMIDAILSGDMGPGEGWFGPGRSRLGWTWLTQRMDVDGDGQITIEEFQGPREWFARLDRNGDGVLTAADFDWSPKPPPMPPRDRGKPAPPKDAKKGEGMPPRQFLLDALFRGELGSPYEGPRIGYRAPLFTLPTHDGKRTVALADHIGEKPVVLIFGSFT